MKSAEALTEPKGIAIGVAQPKLSGLPGLVLGGGAGQIGKLVNRICPEIHHNRANAVTAAFAEVQFVAALVADRGISQACSVWVVNPVLGESDFGQQLDGWLDFAYGNHRND